MRGKEGKRMNGTVFGKEGKRMGTVFGMRHLEREGGKENEWYSVW